MIYHPYDSDIIPIFYSDILTIRLVIYQYVIINMSGYVFIIHLAEMFGNVEIISSDFHSEVTKIYPDNPHISLSLTRPR